MPNITLLDIAKRNLGDREVGLIEESLLAAPELTVVPSRLRPGTSYRTTVRESLPTASFRNANEGVAGTKSGFRNDLFEMHLLDSKVIVDKAVATANIGGPQELLDDEAIAQLEASFRHAGKVFYYGRNATRGDAKGFPGLVDSYDSTNMKIDATGSSNRSSAWLVALGQQKVQFQIGQNTALQVGDVREELVNDAAGNPFDAFVQPMLTWIGLQVGSKNDAVRIGNLGTGAGKGLTDDLIYQALEKFPVGTRPSALFMNRRSVRQLRESRTATNPTGMPAPTPTAVDGLQIILTDSIVNSEAAA